MFVFIMSSWKGSVAIYLYTIAIYFPKCYYFKMHYIRVTTCFITVCPVTTRTVENLDPKASHTIHHRNQEYSNHVVHLLRLFFTVHSHSIDLQKDPWVFGSQDKRVLLHFYVKARSVKLRNIKQTRAQSWAEASRSPVELHRNCTSEVRRKVIFYSYFFSRVIYSHASRLSISRVVLPTSPVTRRVYTHAWRSTFA